MRLDAELAFWRRMEESLWRCQVRITRPGTDRPFDASTGQHDNPDPEVIYEGPGQVRSFKWEGADTLVGEEEVRYRGARAKVPANTPVERNDRLEVLAATHDTELVGRTFRVTDVERDDWQIVRRLILEETT